jgi:hypothetical protein
MHSLACDLGQLLDVEREGLIGRCRESPCRLHFSPLGIPTDRRLNGYTPQWQACVGDHGSRSVNRNRRILSTCRGDWACISRPLTSKLASWELFRPDRAARSQVPPPTPYLQVQASRIEAMPCVLALKPARVHLRVECLANLAGHALGTAILALDPLRRFTLNNERGRDVKWS